MTISEYIRVLVSHNFFNVHFSIIPKKVIECAPFINTTVIDNEIGTVEEPYLSNISTGERTGESVIFHTEENGQHFEYVRHHITSTGFSGRCIYFNRPGVKCKASRVFTYLDNSILKCEKRPKRNIYGRKRFRRQFFRF